MVKLLKKQAGEDGPERFLRGEVIITEYIVDLDANPMVPVNWKVTKHIQGGSFVWDPTKVVLYLSKHQQDYEHTDGNTLRQELEGKTVFNANLLDYLLAHPYLIPKDWKGKVVHFWGTVYRHSGGDLCVRYLYCHGDQWDWGCSKVDDHFTRLGPVALHAV